MTNVTILSPIYQLYPKTGELNIKEPYIDYEDKLSDKKHKVYKFDNGWGVSIAQGKNCYGCTKEGHWSLSTVYWLSNSFWDFDIHIENPVCDGDVLWNVSDEEIHAILLVVEKFPVYSKNVFKDR